MAGVLTQAKTPPRIAERQANPQTNCGAEAAFLHHNSDADRKTRGLLRLSRRLNRQTVEVGL